MGILTIFFAALLQIVPAGQSYFAQKQQRDSILIADQLEYGFELKDIAKGTQLALPEFDKTLKDTLVLVRNWAIDTLKTKGSGLNVRGTVLLAAFEEGKYLLPDIPVLRKNPDGSIDSLMFEGREMEVKTIAIDTTTYKPHDLKGQIKYPLTFKEMLPFIGGALALAAIIAAIVYVVKRARRRKEEEGRPKEPPYLTALKGLENYRGEKYWAADKQKLYYSGITDILRAYMASRFEFDAREMTTAEIFGALKGNKDLTPELYGAAKELFELADFVKFAKHIASRDENAAALPTAVSFVTSTYRAEPEEQTE